MGLRDILASEGVTRTAGRREGKEVKKILADKGVSAARSYVQGLMSESMGNLDRFNEMKRLWDQIGEVEKFINRNIAS